jgi:purine-nucleoside phosphorylase
MQNKLAHAAAAKLAKRSKLRPSLAIVLGSGFHHLVRHLKVDLEIAYADLPGFPRPTVQGHSGKLFLGHIGATPVAVLSGRAHFYEGHPMETVTHSIRVLHAFGVKDVLLTNAAGGINRRFRAGDFMVLRDHINLMGTNPLRGTDPGLPRFVDMTAAYDPELRRVIRRCGKGGVKIREGVYLAVSGPSYETSAEIEAFARWGADAVGMSTVPETIVARQCGMRVAGLSCITNLAAGRSGAPLSHQEVLETAHRVQNVAAELLRSFVDNYAKIKA